MNNNKSLFESIIGIFGVITLFILIYNTFKTIANKTETNVISDKALRAIQNPGKAIQLRKAIDKYHETGDWEKT